MKSKRIIATIILFTFISALIIGCNKGEKESVVYEEKISSTLDLSIIYQFEKMGDGKIIVLGKNMNNEIKCYISEDQAINFTEKEISNINLEEKSHIYKVIISNNYDLAVLYSKNTIDDSNKELYIKIIHDDGREVNMDTSIISVPNDISFSKQGDLVISDEKNSIFQFDIINKELKYKYENNNINGYSIDGDYLYIYNDKETIKYNLSSNLVEETFDNVILANNDFIFSDKKNRYIYTNNCINGLDNNKLNKIIDGRNNSLSDQYKKVINIISLEKDNFVVAFNTGEIYRYYTKKEKKKDKLSVYSLNYSYYLEELIATYNRSNKTDIEYIYGIDESNSISSSEAIKKLNIEIKANKGPDILVLDGLPIDAYIEKDYLEDISDIYDDISDKIFKNIVESSFRKDNLYYLPFAFRIPMITGENIDKICDINDLKNFIINNKDNKNIINFDSLEEYVDYFYSLYGDSLINEDKTVNIENTKDFLINCKELYDAIRINNKSNKDESLSQMDMLSRSGYFYTFGSENKSLVEVGSISDINGYSAIISLRKNDNINSNVFGESESNIYFPSELIAINSLSKNKSEARKFIKDIFSMNSKRNYLGENSTQLLCTNKNIFEDGVKKSLINDIIFIENDEVIVFKGIEFSTEEMFELEDIVNKLNKGKFINIEVLNLIQEDLYNYILGEQDIDKCINSISNNLEIYLAE